MSDKTDETARAIAECQHVDFFNFDPLFKQERFVDLQKLAKFWLIKKDITKTFTDLRHYLHPDKDADVIGHIDAYLNYLKELDG